MKSPYRILLGMALGCLAGPAHAGGKVELVVGNSDYTHASDLPQASIDAQNVADTLQSLGFTVASAIDTTDAELERAIAAFQVALRGADVGFFYYAGHGVQVDGENYLVPIDAALPDPAYLDAEAVRAELRALAGRGERRGDSARPAAASPGLRVLIIDDEADSADTMAVELDAPWWAPRGHDHRGHRLRAGRAPGARAGRRVRRDIVKPVGLDAIRALLAQRAP